MTAMTITIERIPKTIQFNGAPRIVEELGVELCFSRKPSTLSEVCGGEPPCRVLITEIREMTPTEFDIFAACLSASYDWLNGKGGYAGEARLCVEVRAPGRPFLYVDPSGGDYARYVARLG